MPLLKDRAKLRTIKIPDREAEGRQKVQIEAPPGPPPRCPKETRI